MFAVQRKESESIYDCLGIHEVMAKQVRPWLANPVGVRAQKVRLTDRGVNQQIPSGTVGAKDPQSKSECTGAIFTY